MVGREGVGEVLVRCLLAGVVGDGGEINQQLVCSSLGPPK